ncbi:MAG: lipopolysaccharide export LptBFGC system permease protein LptF [Crocinitomicaceae bacterium]|jgi:lipopolysaccharide export LptBFGC system permease protein LptF
MLIMAEPMLTADRYIGKQIISTTIFAVLILSGVFLLGNIFKEARPLFVGKHPSPYLILEFIFSILPFSLMFTIPFSFLAAVMLVFGRLSADNELVGMRMAGRSLPRIALPVFASAILLSGFCYWLNVKIAPEAKVNVKELLIKAVKEDPNKFLDPGVVQTQLNGKRIYVRAREGDMLYGVHIHDIGDESTAYREKLYTYAESAHLDIDVTKGQLQLKLQDATIETVDKNGIHTPITVSAVNPVIFDFSLENKKRIKASWMTNAEISQYLQDNPNLEPEKVAEFKNQITHRQSYSLACIAFALVGVPLGMSSRRKESSSGFALSIAIGLGYFLFHIFAGKSDSDSGNLATILYWMPNILALILGIYLFLRARRK